MQVRSVLPDVLRLFLFGTIPFRGSDGMGLTIAAPWGVAGDVANKTLEGAGHPSLVFHHGHIQ
jgi:hypothetical protein